jgi:hypothetical protein
LFNKRVRFKRVVARAKSPIFPTVDVSTTEALFRRAMEISGVSDRDKLMQMALTTFIQREAGRQLALLGGTMPDCEVPRRERPEP